VNVWTRRQFLAASSIAAAQTRRPNVLVVMSDQESALLPGPVKLPNRDKLGGARFSAAFCNTPQCSAARCALLTGLEPHRAGVLTNVDGGSLGKPLPADLPTVGSVFQSAGYSTGYFGKWHLGQGNRTGWQATGAETGDARVAAQAAAWISGQREPWLAWVSFLNPHDIYKIPTLVSKVKPRPGVKPPSSDLRNLEDKPGEQREYVENDQGRQTAKFSPEDWIRYRSYYCDLVEQIDGLLGQVLAAVPAFENTVVVYTADHGDALGEHGLPYKGPFMYEELIRIPLVIRAPGAWTRSQRRDDLVTQADLAPTLAALCRIEWPGAVSGADLSRGPLPRDAVFLEYYAKQKWVNPIRTVRTRGRKLNLYDRGNRELYDIAADPQESRNLAKAPEHAKQLSELERRLTAWRPPLLSKED
jgi:choline-sulfatase